MEDGVAGGFDLDGRKTVLVEVPAKRWYYVVRVDADDVAELAGGGGASGDGVHRLVGVAGDVGEDFEAAPAEDALRGSEARLAPILVYGGTVGAAADLREIGEGAFNGWSEGVGAPFGDADGAAAVGY